MFSIGRNRGSALLLTIGTLIWANNWFAAAQTAYPNPFAHSPSVQPSVKPVGSMEYPNPFANNQNQPKPVESDQAWADSICQNDSSFGAGYVAARDASGTWACVVMPDTTKSQPCFGEWYIDSQTNQAKCRPKPIPNCPGSPNCELGKSFQTLNKSTPIGACCKPGDTYACDCKDGGSYVYDPLSCPVLHRNIRVTPNGPKFNLFCNISTKRREIKSEPAGSFIECVDACGALEGCAGVEFNKLTKQCSFKSEFLTEDSEGGANNDVDSASMDPPPQCPDAEGKTLTTGGVEYELFCTHGWKVGLPMGASTKAENIYDCTRQCTAQGNACQGANYWFADKDCVMTTTHEFPPTGGNAGNAMVGAIPKKQK